MEIFLRCRLPRAARRIWAARWRRLVFPTRRCRDFHPSWPRGKSRRCRARGMTRAIFKSACRCSRAIRVGRWWIERGNVIGIVSAKLDASVALAASGALPENVNYAVKSSLLLSFLESVPEVAAKLKTPNTKDESFQDVVKSAQDAAVLVLVY